MMLQKRSKHIFILSTMCFSITCGTFIAERKSSFKHTYATLTARSAIECCEQCTHAIACNSANFCPNDKTCELNDRSPVDFPYSQVVATPDKDLYYIRTDPCPHPWILYHRHCYRVVYTTQTWQQSEQNCNTMGAYLTDILDVFENTFVRQIADDAGIRVMWIGMGNYHTIQPQIWTSGQPLGYTHFSPNEPSSSGAENCINFYPNGEWNDQPCNSHLSSVCKKRQY